MSMLSQAIVDSKQLKEAALRDAEKNIISKYAEELKENLDSLREQEDDELDLDGLGDDDLGDPLADLGDEPSGELDPTAGDLPSAATEGEQACACPDSGEEIEINFDELRASMDDEEDELDDLGVLGGEEDDFALGEGGLEGEGETVTIPAHLGSELHLYHSGMGDSVYKVGSQACAVNPVSKDLVFDAVGSLESLQGKLGNEADENELDLLLMNLYEIVPEARDDMGMEDEMSSDIDLSEIEDSVLDDIMETLTVDLEEVPIGHGLNAPTAEEEHNKDIKLASLADDRRKEEHGKLQKSVKKLQEEKRRLSKQVSSLETERNSLKDIARQAAKKTSGTKY